MKKVKIRKVRDTKNPTVRQLQTIAENLGGRFKTYVHVTIGSTTSLYLDKSSQMDYGIYLECDFSGTHLFKSWQGLLEFYHSLMSKTKEEICG